jgi:hemin uptake protein HemP
MNEPKPRARPKRPNEIDSRELLGSDRELVIVHHGERYTLRLTVNDKLILTK